MEPNLVIAMTLPFALVLVVAVSTAAVRALRRTPAPPLRHTNTTIAVLEDTLANLVQARDAITAGQEIATAAREGRYRGDVLEAFSSVLREVEQCSQQAVHVVRQGREGAYHPATTERELCGSED